MEIEKPNSPWVEYGTSIKVNMPDWMFDAILQKQKETEECNHHWMGYTVFSNAYRKYRRGKNRCIRCGLKKELD